VAVPLPQRVPENAPGDFYVEADLCTQCCIVHGEAPELMNDRELPFTECYFRRQPQNAAEVERAIAAMCVSEMDALRYGGSDEAIILALRDRGCAHLCDQADEGQAYLRRREAAAAERLTLQYRSPAHDEYARGMSGDTRVLAGIGVLTGLIAIASYVRRSRYAYAGLAERLPVVAVAVAGIIFLVLIAAGLIGRHKRNRP